MNKLICCALSFFYLFISNKIYADCCDCGPIYNDQYFELDFCIDNNDSIKVSKSLFNIASLLETSDYFNISRTIELERNFLEQDGKHFLTFFWENHQLIWHKEDSICTPLWIFESGWAWHEPIFIDLNKDDKLDLFVRSGNEDLMETLIYINQIDTIEYNKDNFTLGYHKLDDYLNIIDINQDGSPELLETVNPINEYNDFVAYNVLNKDWTKIQDSSLIKDIKTEYYQIFNQYDSSKFNFDYGMPEYRFYFHLRLFKEIRIISFNNTTVIDKTQVFSNHINWRIKTLNRLLDYCTKEGRIDLEKLIIKYNSFY